MNRKPLDDHFFMKWAHDVSQASTCVKIQVGSVIVKDRRVISIGYNGTPPGHLHCCDHFILELSPESLGEEAFLRHHATFSEQSELHSEQNAILDAYKRQESLVGATLYTTWSPCFSCAKVILTTGIERVFYDNLYRQDAVNFLSRYTRVQQIGIGNGL
jgi:dCMP deaminase